MSKITTRRNKTEDFYEVYLDGRKTKLITWFSHLYGWTIALNDVSFVLRNVYGNKEDRDEALSLILKAGVGAW